MLDPLRGVSFFVLVAGCHLPDYAKDNTREGCFTLSGGCCTPEPLFPLAEPATVQSLPGRQYSRLLELQMLYSAT